MAEASRLIEDCSLETRTCNYCLTAKVSRMAAWPGGLELFSQAGWDVRTDEARTEYFFL